MDKEVKRSNKKLGWWKRQHYWVKAIIVFIILVILFVIYDLIISTPIRIK